MSKKTYAYTIYDDGDLGTPESTASYVYGNNAWRDLLTAWNGNAITYDAIGNPTRITTSSTSGYDLTWQGRQLMSYAGYGDNAEALLFTYNADGIRTSKTVNGVKHEYYLNGSQIVAESTYAYQVIYLYNELGAPIGLGLHLTGSPANLYEYYLFEKNAQGDIIAVYKFNGAKIGTYTYDAWGNCTVTQTGGIGWDDDVLYTINPFRYRGYFYDVETGLYYLQSRYYNPQWGRFINPDAVMAGVGGDLRGYNLYTYCFNNPVMYSDGEGEWPSWNEFWNGVGDFFYNIGEAFVTSLEFEVGVGIGLGFDISNNITAEVSRDTYVGIDDGVLVTGNIVATEFSLADFLSIGDTYNHLVEKDDKIVSSSAHPLDGPFDLINYPDVKRGNQFAIGPFVVNESGEFLISVSASAHLGGGGRISLSFNFSEFFERLLD